MDVFIPRMQAYLDSFTKVTLFLSKDYYQGQCDTFYLKDLVNHQLFPLKIISQESIDHGCLYECYIENIELEKEYAIGDAYGLFVPLVLRYVVYDPLFDERYSYDGKDLGPIYTKERTQFKIWAPTAYEVILKYQKDHRFFYRALTRLNHGVYSVSIDDDLECVSYTYLIRHGDHFYETVDPYAYGSLKNGRASVVLNLEKTNMPFHHDGLAPFHHKTDAIIYELNIRDFTHQSTLKAQHPATFLGTIESQLKTPYGQSAGFDHLKDLGVTHVQIMPMYDFATVDEDVPSLFYNWGYDPLQYNVPEGSYATCEDPYARVNECKAMISEFHRHGIRVTMDVVFNHVFDVYSHAFDKIVPHYYYRVNDAFERSNGSFCSNDLNTEAPMVQKYILDMCERWQNFYGVDGYRFDLMGIIDIETITKVEKTCSTRNPDFMIYGEGWNMPTALEDLKKATMDNANQLPQISFFNDQFRNILRGPHDQDHLHEMGYLGGNTFLTDACQNLLTGLSRFQHPNQSINYLECHDNCTLWDKFQYSNAHDSLTIRKKRQILGNAFVILSQGIPFLHAGQEFCRTKQGISNTYRSLDDINEIDWSWKDKNKEVFEATQYLIQLRKKNMGLRYETREDIERYVSVETIDYRMLVYTIQQDEQYQELKIIFNPSSESIYTKLYAHYDILYSIDSTDEQIAGDTILVTPINLLILGKKEG